MISKINNRRFESLAIENHDVKLVIYTDSPNSQDPQSFEKDDLTPSQPLEKLKYYFGRFFLNSLETDFSLKIEVKNAKVAQNFIIFVFFSKNFLKHNVMIFQCWFVF